MGTWADIARVFVVGVVSIGMVTALFANGRKTTDALKVTFKGADDLLHTAESG